jgi:putative ABC transport system substrate-binding protein
MKRRDFITLLGGAAAAWPLAARAQQPRVIGMLINSAADSLVSQSRVKTFTEQLRKLGWVDGKNLRIEYRWDPGNPTLTRAYAAELVSLAPDVILSVGTGHLTALLRLGPATPIVFTVVSDPLVQGFVTNTARPGANITGFANLEFTIGGKWLDLLKQIAPGIDHVAVMFNPETAPQTRFFMSSIESAGRTLGGVRVAATPIESAAGIESVVAHLAEQPNGGLIIPPDSFADAHRAVLVATASRYRVPAIAARPDFVGAGGVMSYVADLNEQFRQAAVYVDRILKGTKPGDLPVQAPAKFSLSINLKTARDLGIEIPLSLLLIADEQIE